MELSAVSALELSVDQLRHVANYYPIIDNHAHNLIVPEYRDTIPFESITSEAQGRALQDTFKSLAHIRAARQLRQLYECSDDADWAEVLEQRLEWLRSDPEQLNQRCFHGVHALLIDDGLARPEKVHPYHFHDQYTKVPSKRIIRIETLAERLMQSILRDSTIALLDHESFFTDTWVDFTEEFERQIIEAVLDPEVAGFKTVICYRTGLDIESDYQRAAEEVGYPFEHYVARCIRKRKFRIERKPLNDYLVLRTLEVLSDQLPHPDALSKPLQLHTGLGDNDISLLQSNPAYLQPLIETYSKVPFVLLHSSYPYTREAGYLSSVYKHVYLDLGEAFPMVSRDGQKSILRQSLELVPGNKLLYSSDGHFLPETFWLANKQFREVWLELLIEYIEKQDITTHQAIAMTKDVLFNNSNVLYDLRYVADFEDLMEPQKSIEYSPKSELAHSVSPTNPFQGPRMSTEDNVAPSFLSSTQKSYVYDVQLFETFMTQNPGIKFVYVQWLDYMATIRARIVPIKEFDRLVRSGDRIGISQGNTGTLQNDGATPVVNPVGQIYVEPDLRSLRITHKKDVLPSATVLSFWRDEAGRPLRECPRANLEILIDDFRYNHSISLLCGFEIEVTFVSRNPNNTEQPYTPLTQTHAWGTITPEQWIQLPFLAEIATSLSEMDIEVQQFHSESGLGQYEFVLAPQPPLAAIDSLLQARQVIAQIAALHDLRATLHAQPFPGVGTAAHAHISLDTPANDMQFFVGGVLRHLPALCAFTMPQAESYERVKDDQWTGGSWIAWGTQNRETPLRRVNPGRWEVRCLDGFANMYFALSAIITAGSLGLKRNEEVASLQKDVQCNPALLDEDERVAYGVTERLPKSLSEAVNALEADGELKEALADGLVRDYLLMKRSEQEMLGRMGEAERRVWLMERY